jgi:putative CocE/NonD family hydrolase
VPDQDCTPAWRVPPSAYLATRPPEWPVSPPASQYVTMRDGCDLAVDVYLPDGAGPCPAVLILTPYYRRFALKPGTTGVEAAPGAARWRDLFVPRGYALVVVDVRGTGASFGTRDSFRSPTERDDYREIADWVVSQPWSNGTIGATGISYVGAACDFLASTGHQAVKAIAPLFAVWDTHADHYYPGGILLHRLAEGYDRLMVAMDHDRREMLQGFAYYAEPALDGPAPVDGDNGARRDAAVREHLGNFRMPDFITEFRFREEPLPYDPAFSSASFSPYHYADGIAPDVAVYSVSGWMDGAGYANGALARFLTLPNPKRHLLLGPWDHGARSNVSPWRDAVAPRFCLDGELLRFFDHYLQGRATGLEAEAPVHVFTLHSEAWQAAPDWPVVANRVAFALDANACLGVEASPGTDTLKVDFSFGTGRHTRYGRLAADAVTDYYTDWQDRDAGLLRYDSAPLAADQEMTGHGVLDLWLSADTPDAAVHAYLSEIEADGTQRYVTEGVLRALHRKESPPPAHYKAAWPFRSYSRADAAPLRPGQPALLRVVLLPTSWQFKAGSRIRLSISGADSDHYAQVPHGRPPVLTVHRGPSVLHLPLSSGWHLIGDATPI